MQTFSGPSCHTCLGSASLTSSQEPALRFLYRKCRLTSPQHATSFYKALKTHSARGSLVKVLSYPQTELSLSAILQCTPNLTRIYLAGPSHAMLHTVCRRSGEHLQALIARTSRLPPWTKSQLNEFFAAFKVLRVLELETDIAYHDNEVPKPTTLTALPLLEKLAIRRSHVLEGKPGLVAFISGLRYAYYYIRWISWGLTRLLCSVPSLRHLELGFVCEYLPVFLGYHGPQIETLALPHFGYEGSVLVACSSLQTLQLHSDGQVQTGTPPWTLLQLPTTHPSLHRLEVQSCLIQTRPK